MPKYLGIDYGTKRVGLAASDDEGKVAFPRSVLPQSGELVAQIAAVVREEEMAGVVVGESRDRRGKENPVMKDARAFAEKLERATGVTVTLEPEFYSTQEAKHMRDEDTDIDAGAAAVILQSYLDRQQE